MARRGLWWDLETRLGVNNLGNSYDEGSSRRVQLRSILLEFREIWFLNCIIDGDWWVLGR